MWVLIITVYLTLPNGQTLIDRHPPRPLETEAACQAAAAAAAGSSVRESTVRVLAYCAPGGRP